MNAMGANVYNDIAPSSEDINVRARIRSASYIRIDDRSPIVEKWNRSMSYACIYERMARATAPKEWNYSCSNRHNYSRRHTYKAELPGRTSHEPAMAMIHDLRTNKLVAPTKWPASSRNSAATSNTGRYTNNSAGHNVRPSANPMTRSPDKVASADMGKRSKTRDKIDARIPRSPNRIYLVTARAAHAMNSKLRMTLRKIVWIEGRKMMSAGKSRKRAISTYESRKWRRIEEPPNRCRHGMDTDERARRK